MREQLTSFWKFLLSFRKQDWTLDDYPLRTVTQNEGTEVSTSADRFRVPKYRVDVLGWWLAGTGDTEEDARANLEQHFANAKLEKTRSGEPMPRPGTRVPIQFAADAKIQSHGELIEDFTHRVLQLEWAWISDESSLWDFHVDVTNDALNAKIKEVYGVDVSDIESGRLAEIFDRIDTTRL